MDKYERRAFECSVVELRVEEDGTKTVEGYAIKWDQFSVPLGWFYKFREKFKRGAFTDYLTASTDTKFLVGHDINKVLGRRANNTLELKEDDVGLHFRAILPKTTMGNDIHELVKRGDVDKISVGFSLVKEEWDETDENNPVRTVLKANLPEISLTAWPAYEQTEANARSIDPYKEYLESKTVKRSMKYYENLIKLSEMED